MRLWLDLGIGHIVSLLSASIDGYELASRREDQRCNYSDSLQSIPRMVAVSEKESDVVRNLKYISKSAKEEGAMQDL